MSLAKLWICVAVLCTSPALAQNAPPADSPAPLPPAEAPKHMTLPPGFHASIFAGEPDVVQPIAFTFDDRGRLWVVENFSYPNWQTEGTEGHDRILIFEDPDGAGHFKTRKVFWDKGLNLSGIEVGFGGVWLCSTPNFTFIPMNEGEDKPAGPPQILLDGWSLQAKHNVFNRLTWGPDGWLYGCNGILATSNVGKPGTPDNQRIPFNCGVWRYHPTRHEFETVAWGTTNPWGLDFDDLGQMFITNCVIKHLWYVIPGAHYLRMYGQDLNPYAYGLMESCADHIHWAGGDWTSSRGGFGAHSAAGGGHAHAGAMIYLGDNWPDSYRNSLFTCNIHGNRVNNDILEHQGSGYVARHGKDFLFANDSWFRGLDLRYGPDGGVIVSDWTDTGECHNYSQIDRANGRLYKVTYGEPAKVRADVAHASDDELVKLVLHKNEWWSRHARRVLQERAAAGKLGAHTQDALRSILTDDPQVAHKLRALWALHVAGGLNDGDLRHLLTSPEPYVRGWAIQLATEGKAPSSTLLGGFEELAKADPSPVTRLFLASAMQRVPIAQRWGLAEKLAAHGEDAGDLNLPSMVWYGIEPAVPTNPGRAAALAGSARLSVVRESIARRLATPGAEGLTSLVKLLDQSTDPGVQLDVVKGMNLALQEQRHVEMPPGWQGVARKILSGATGELREKTTVLSLVFGDPESMAALRKTVSDAHADVPARQRALQALAQHKDPELAPLLQKVLADREMAGPALRALADCPGDETPRAILSQYANLGDAERKDAINTLASRPAWADALLDAIERGTVARSDLSTVVIRQIMTLNDPKVSAKLGKVWGNVRWSSDDKKALIARFKATYTPEVIKNADLSNGRLVFNRTCAQCHTLYDSGGKVGPNLTGSQRANLDYVFENVLDPSAVVAKEYLMTIVQTKDGRVLNGIIQQETPTALTLRTTTEDVAVPKNEITKRNTSNISMMPEGVLEALSPTDARDLIGYLGSTHQVPAAEEKAK